jgi:hypothetical protein
VSAQEHDRSLFGAYTLGVLDPDEVRAIDEHLATCDECRAELDELAEMKEFLGEVPPEAFLDGPPEDGDLLLQRTLRQVRSESASIDTPQPVPQVKTGRSRGLLAAAAVAVIAGASLGGGVLIGQNIGEPSAQVSSTPTGPIAGEKHATATDAGTGTTMAATVIPKAGWVVVHIKADGLPAGAQCELRVVDKAGHSFVAGSWLVSEKLARQGSTIDGTALVPITQVKSVDVVTIQGKRMVSVPLPA